MRWYSSKTMYPPSGNSIWMNVEMDTSIIPTRTAAHNYHNDGRKRGGKFYVHLAGLCQNILQDIETAEALASRGQSSGSARVMRWTTTAMGDGNRTERSFHPRCRLVFRANEDCRKNCQPEKVENSIFTPADSLPSICVQRSNLPILPSR